MPKSFLCVPETTLSSQTVQQSKQFNFLGGMSFPNLFSLVSFFPVGKAISFQLRFGRPTSSPLSGSLNCGTTGRCHWCHSFQSFHVMNLFVTLGQFFQLTCRILPSSATGLVQVDDRSTENLWVRMVQTPFPYGGGLMSLPTEVSLGVTPTVSYPVTANTLWHHMACDSWHVPQPTARLRVSWEFLSAGHHTSDRHVPASHRQQMNHDESTFLKNSKELKQQEGKQPQQNSAWGATWLWWEHKVWILEVLLLDQQAGIQS